VELAALGKAPFEPIKPLLTAPEPTVEALAKHWPILPGALSLFSAAIPLGLHTDQRKSRQMAACVLLKALQFADTSLEAALLTAGYPTPSVRQRGRGPGAMWTWAPLP
jgi:hypothetical protein